MHKENYPIKSQMTPHRSKYKSVPTTVIAKEKYPEFDLSPRLLTKEDECQGDREITLK